MMRTSCADEGKRGVDLAYDLAREEISKADPLLLCSDSGATYDPARGIVFLFLNSRHVVSHPEGRVYRDDGQEEQPRVAVLLLHYLIQAKGIPLSGKEIDFRDLPGGIHYLGPFAGRTTNRLAREFGEDPALLRDAATSLQAELVGGFGDVAFVIDALPDVPVTVVFWRQDDEFPAKATILFDASVTKRLSTEDVIVLSETLVGELIRRAREMRKDRSGV